MVTCFSQTAIFKWYLVKCGSKNGHQKVLCLKEIGLHAQNLSDTLGSIFIIIWGLMSSKIFTLVTHKILT